MRIDSILMLGRDEDIEALIQDVVQRSFPGASIKTIPSLETALGQEETAGTEILVLIDPAPDNLALTIKATQKHGLRRWPVIVFGTGEASEGVEFLSLEERDVRYVARTLTWMAVWHQWHRENTRLRGDLMTLGRRISHDLRTHLGGILSAGEVLKEVLAEIPHTDPALTQPLFTSAHELAQLINRISLVTKASAQSSTKESVDMSEVVWATLQRLEGVILRQQAVIVQPDSWPMVMGVASWLEVIWWNLLMNALQAKTNALRAKLGWCKEATHYRFWVRDNGPGIPMEKRATLFQPFHRLHHLESVTGLGLSIVQRLTDLQGGDCGYEPVAQGGSCFYFTLPLG